MIDISDFETALPGYFTATEASQALGYANQTYIARLACEGKIKAYKVGKAWLIPESQVKILASQPLSNKYPRGQKR